MELDKIQAEVFKIANDHGWHENEPEDKWGDPWLIPTRLALDHSELSEALEAFRAGDFENFKEELADTVIRIMDDCENLGIDLQFEIMRKCAKNRARPYRHGGKKC